MKIHHLNCACMCPAGGKLFPAIFPQHVICHCLLVESNQGLILIDTGFARAVLEKPRRMGLLHPLLGVTSSVEDAAVEQIKRLGFSQKDVRHLVPTHLDIDHAGATVDFPKATVHTSHTELEAALHPQSLSEKARYRHFVQSPGQKWQAHSLEHGENWFGFKGVRALPQTEDEILLIPLFGHTPGHFGVAVKNDGKWLFHVGDAYYNRAELMYPGSIGLKMFQWVAHCDYKLTMDNQKRLMELRRNHSDEITIFCAHDAREMPSRTVQS